MLGKLRGKYEKSMLPIGAFFSKFLTPNQASILSLLIAFIPFYFYSKSNAIIGGLTLIIAILFDTIDGSIARYTGKTTKFGATLDHTLDRYVEFLALFGIAYGRLASWPVAFFTCFGMIMASFVRAKAESVGGLESCTVGIAERQEKLILILLGSFLYPWNNYALEICLKVVGIISHITVIQRLVYTKKNAIE